MKRINLLVVCILFMQAAFAQWQGNFQMSVINSSRPEPVVIDFTIKDTISLMVIKNERMAPFKTITDRGNNTSTMLIEQGGTNMAIRRKINNHPASAAQNESNVKVIATEEVKEISGYKCKKYLASDENKNMEYWMTEEDILPWLEVLEITKTPGRGMARMQRPIGYQDMKGVPVQYIITDRKTNEITTVTFSNIKKQPVPNSVFDMSGYQMQEMPDLPPGMEMPMPPGATPHSDHK
ncbi:MAG: DUF4412 domain-containing protein [Bacteroidetes bacterium]|nr:DUF4412 domain-containing protein [Bacteroidota bacterium]